MVTAISLLLALQLLSIAAALELKVNILQDTYKSFKKYIIHIFCRTTLTIYTKKAQGTRESRKN
jgi:hypothetical protein